MIKIKIIYRPDPLKLVQVVDVKILCSNTPAKATISELNKLLNQNTEVRPTLSLSYTLHFQ